MSAQVICADINRLFGDLTADRASTLKDMRLIVGHTEKLADLLESEEAYDDDEYEDDFDDEYDEFDDDFSDLEDDEFDDDDYYYDDDEFDSAA